MAWTARRIAVTVPAWFCRQQESPLEDCATLGPCGRAKEFTEYDAATET